MGRRQYFRVGPSFWIDHAEWDDDTRLVALYVLTCPHRTTEGLFRMPLEYAETDLGWKPQRFRKAFDRLVAAEFVAFDPDASVCLIVNALKWQRPENPNQVKATVKHVDQLPASPLVERFVSLAETHCPRLAEALREGLRQPFAQGLPQPVPEGSPNLHTPTPIEPPQPPASGGSWPCPPVKPTGNRRTDLQRFDREVAAYAAWLLPDVDDPERDALVAQAIGWRVEQQSNEFVARFVLNVIEHGTPFPKPEPVDDGLGEQRRAGIAELGQRTISLNENARRTA